MLKSDTVKKKISITPAFCIFQIQQSSVVSSDGTSSKISVGIFDSSE